MINSLDDVSPVERVEFIPKYFSEGHYLPTVLQFTLHSTVDQLFARRNEQGAQLRLGRLVKEFDLVGAEVAVDYIVEPKSGGKN